MVKIYRAKSIISINVTLPNGSSRHISFDETHDGCSVFVTSDPLLQRALESNSEYNSWFTLSHTEEPQTTSEEPAPVEEKKNTIKVSSVADARDYLVETYEISRTALRTKAAILAAADELNITFDGLK